MPLFPTGFLSEEPGLPETIRRAWNSIHWNPFGDMTPIGWTITISYFVAAVLTSVAYRRELKLEALRIHGVRAQFWKWLTVAMVLLGLNKQLDLQKLVTKFGRAIVLGLHVYSMRRPMQVLFIGLIALGGLALVVFVVRKMRGLRSHYVVALIGIVFLCVFIVSRAASFHNVDVLLSMRFHDVYVNTFLELGGIVAVAVAAVVSFGVSR